MNELNIIGLMSGTSMDGIDGTILYTNGKTFKRTNIFSSIEYNKKTKNILKKIEENPLKFITDKSKLNEANTIITKDHFKLVKILKNKFQQNLNLIAFHGQTIYHNPHKKMTIQLGDPQLLADLSNVNVISNFRDADIKNGGQGAPISPIYHKTMMEQMHLDLPACFINIGGVANLTYWDGTKLLGFDTGPGNGLLDKLIKKKTGKDFDYNGLIAMKGKPDNKSIKRFIKHEYFDAPPPKSLDKLFFFDFISDIEIDKLSLEDASATLSHLTTETIILSTNNLPMMPKLFVILGGGRKNRYIVEELKNKLVGEVVVAEDINLFGQYIEAEMMAFLGSRSINKLPITFPTTTGVINSTSGGVFYQAK